ncbi:MAG: TonB-dependent receptor [Novosphingobium sp.]
MKVIVPKLYACSALVGIGLLGSAEAMAQAPDSKPKTYNDEIIVTAQKREQRLQDVGITITTATNEQLQTAGVSDVSSLAKVTSGFSAGRTTHGYPVFSIRGVGFNSSQLSAAPTVSSYIDEAALPYPSMTGGLLLDVDHIEVLKGPQGTLFGQNATGGSINVIAAKPTNFPKAGLGIEVNNFGQVMANGFVSGPLSDTLRMRVAVATTQFGDWQKGYYLNNDKRGDQNRLMGRVLTEWTPTDRLTLRFMLNGYRDKGEPQVVQLAALSIAAPSNAAPGLIDYPKPPKDNRYAETDINGGNDIYVAQGVLRVDYDLNDALSLTSITNYIRHRHRQLIDGDATALTIARVLVDSHARSFGQELRLTGEAMDGQIHFVLGGNYQKDKFREELNEQFAAYSSLPPNSTLRTRFNPTARSTAVFGNIDWEFVPGLTLTAGARHTWAKQTTRGCTYDTGDGSWAGFLTAVSTAIRGAQGLAPPPPIAPGGCASLDDTPSLPGGLAPFLPTVIELAQKEENTSWRVGLNYKPTPDTLIYGLVSRGYKAGVFPFTDTIVTSQIGPIRQEELTSYEVGFKADLLDRRISLEASAYHYDYRDKQFFTYKATPFIGAASTLVNIPKSKLNGFEVSTVLRPTDSLTFRGGSKWSGTSDLEYRVPLGVGMEGFVGGSLTYNSSAFADLSNSDLSRMKAYTLLDARVGVASDKGWRASLFARNLTNEYYWVSVGLLADAAYRIAGLPRTFGASVNFDF